MMGKFRAVGVAFSASVSLLALSACAGNAGTQTVNDFSNYMAIDVGASDRPDVYSSFGQPHAVSTTDEGAKVWSYFNSRGSMSAVTFVPVVGLFLGGSNVDYTRADFHFDDTGVLQEFDRLQTRRYANQWGQALRTASADDLVLAVRAEMDALGLPFDDAAALQNARLARAAE